MLKLCFEPIMVFLNQCIDLHIHRYVSVCLDKCVCVLTEGPYLIILSRFPSDHILKFFSDIIKTKKIVFALLISDSWNLRAPKELSRVAFRNFFPPVLCQFVARLVASLALLWKDSLKQSLVPMAFRGCIHCTTLICQIKYSPPLPCNTVLFSFPAPPFLTHLQGHFWKPSFMPSNFQ